MFTNQILNHQPPSDSTILYSKNHFFQITADSAYIYYEYRPKFIVATIARKGDIFSLREKGDQFCLIELNDTTVWVDQEKGHIFSNQYKPTLLSEMELFFILAVLIFVISLIIFIVVFIKSKNSNHKDSETEPIKTVMIFATTTKEIVYSLTNKTSTIEKCFLGVGFEVLTVKSIDEASTLLGHSIPNLVLVDWNFTGNSQVPIERLFTQRSTITNTLIVFYNVPDISNVIKSTLLPNTIYLGFDFSDRELFKLITPFLVTSIKSRSIQKSVQSSALEGEIENGNLLEVLQFIEIGSKTGCLLIEQKQPFGLIYFQNGRIVYAAAETHHGKAAVFAILDLHEGKFRFILNRQAKFSNISASSLEILMEWTKTLDEAHGR